jgi:hypothetical protein
LVIKEMHLFEITIFKSKLYKICWSDQILYVLRFSFPDFYSLRPLGDWAPFLRHLYKKCLIVFYSSFFLLGKLKCRFLLFFFLFNIFKPRIAETADQRRIYHSISVLFKFFHQDCPVPIFTQNTVK